jgi:Site-specific recombinase XerD
MISHRDLLNDYLFHRVLRPKTEEGYRDAIKKLEKGISTPIDMLEYNELLEWRRRELRKGLSPTSWNTYMRHLKALFNHGINQGLLPYPHNYFASLFVKSATSPKKRLTAMQVEQIRSLFSIMSKEEENGAHIKGVYPVWFWRVVVETFYFTGIRRSQLVHLRQRDVDFENKVLFMRREGSKGHNEYFVPITNDLLPWLKILSERIPEEVRQSDDHFFCIHHFNPMGRRESLSQNQINAFFRTISERLGFMVSSHRFRHTLGSDLANRPNANIFLIKEALGHQDIRVTMSYLEADLTAIREMLEERHPTTNPQLDFRF